MSTEFPLPSAGRAWLTVAILTLLYGLATVDRQIVSILVTPIKADLALTDVRIGFVQGAFSILFTIVSLPIGWLIDRSRRRLILFAGSLVWSVSAAATGFAVSFAQLFATRAAVGIGEASLQPAAFTIMSDLFRPGRLSLPLSIFVIGANIGNGASYLLGGAALQWLGQGKFALPLLGYLAPWRQVFILMGLPGLALAFAAFVVDDTRRTAHPSKPTSKRKAEWRDLWLHQLRNARFYAGHHIGFAMCLAFAIGLMAWNPAYLHRQFGWGFARIGILLGGTQIIFAPAGLALHGSVIDWLYRTGRKNIHISYFLFTCPIAGCFAALAYCVSSPWLMLALFNLAYFCLIGYPGCGSASLQIATPSLLRGRASACYLVVLNLLGGFCGPLAVALITDSWVADEQQLGTSLAIFSLIAMTAATISFAVAARVASPKADAP